jgi:hypothetical protein
LYTRLGRIIRCQFNIAIEKSQLCHIFETLVTVLGDSSDRIKANDYRIGGKCKIIEG